MKEILLAQGYHRTDVAIAVGGYEEVPQLDPDLMHIKFIMCHEGINANGDTFTKEVLQQAQYTPKNKPVDWEHGQPIIGTILDSVYKEDASGVGYIEATGAVWKFIYPELSSQIKAKASTGELRLSMECYYKDANYQLGDQIFDQETAEKMGIIPYVGRQYMGKRVARVFKEVVFGGVGVVANPADKKAVFLSVAKDLSGHGIDNDSDEESIANISKTIAEAISRSVNDFNKKNPDKEMNHAVTIAKFIKAFDKAKSSIVGKFNKDQITTKESLLLEVRASVNTLLSEVSSISNSYYKGTASEDVTLEDRIQETLASALNTDSSEAYLRAVEEGYVTYEIIDYTSAEQIKAFKAPYSEHDEALDIDFANASELIPEEGVTHTMKVNKTEATELETVLEETQEEAVASEEVVEETVEEVVASQEEAVEEAQVEEAQASELETTIASLQAELESERAEKQALASKIAEFEARFAELESSKVLASRLAELESAGIVFSGARLEKESARIKAMDNEAFADHKEMLVDALASVKPVEVVVAEEVIEEATASEDDVEEDIVVEGAKASAGIVIEQESAKEVRPFGHLSRK